MGLVVVSDEKVVAVDHEDAAGADVDVVAASVAEDAEDAVVLDGSCKSSFIVHKC